MMMVDVSVAYVKACQHNLFLYFRFHSPMAGFMLCNLLVCVCVCVCVCPNDLATS